MPELRIALFTGNYNHIKDGVSLTLNRLVDFLEKKGAKVLVFGPTVDEPPMKHNGTFLSVPSISAPGRPEYRVSIFLPEARRLELEAFNPNVIHIATPDILGLRALFYARSRKIPVISSYHTHFPSYLKYYNLEILEPWIWKYLSWFYSKCEKVVVPSTSMIEWLQKKALDSKLGLWTRGVETEIFNPEKRDMEWRRSMGISDSDTVVSFVSRIVWEKDLKTVIKTMNLIDQERENVRFLIGGDGPALEAMQEQLPQAVYAGYQSGENLARVYAASDIFLFPSDTEAFGNVTLEAAACGVPAVVADAVGSKSIVIHGESGYVTPPRQVRLFADNIIKLIDDPELRNRMSQKAREAALHYDWDAVMNRLYQDYQELITRKG